MPNPLRRPAAGVLIALAVVAVGLFARRAAGATASDLPIGETCLFAVLVTVVAGAALATTRIAVSAFAVALVPAGSFLIGLMFVAGATDDPVPFLAGVAAVGAATAICARLPRSDEGGRTASARPTVPTEAASTELPYLTSESPAGAEYEPPHSDAPAVTFRRTRRGSECVLEGELAVCVPAGEQVHALHVPIWPPLPGDPAVTCELTGVEGRVRTTLAKSYGLRFELRLTEPVDEPLEGELRFTAVADSHVAGDHVAA